MNEVSECEDFFALVVEWYNGALPRPWSGFDSRSAHSSSIPMRSVFLRATRDLQIAKEVYKTASWRQCMGIHNYEAEYARAQEQVTESQLSLKNKQLIFSFVNDLLLEGLSLPRLIKYLRLLRLIGIRINKDFDAVSKDDLKQFISSIQQKITYSPWTIRGYKEIIRRFYPRIVQGE